MEQLTIAAVAKLTGVPAHTLRKWESRHDIGTPQRTESGRRVYNMAQVEQLRLVKLLSDSGHSLSHLADLDLEDLRRLADTHQIHDVQTSTVGSVLLVGHTLAHLALPGARFDLIGREATAGDNWLTINQTGTEHQALAIELATINQSTVDRLLRLAQGHYRQIVVVYDFANRTSLRHLELGGISSLHAPATTESLMAMLQLERPQPEAELSVGPVRFSTAQLAEIAAMTPSIQCECPNHIATLLMNIHAFEQYCRECEDSDPKERVLHAHLADLSAQARAIFETALIEVAKADDLDLDHFESAEATVS